MHIIENSKKLEKIRCVGLVVRPNSPELKKYYLKLKKVLDEEGIELLVSKRSSSYLECKGYDEKKVFLKADFIVSIGGDGTLISLARRAYSYKKPILGVNAGRLRFLTDIPLDEMKSL